MGGLLENITRRDFLKSLGLGGAVLLITPSCDKKIGTNKPIEQYYDEAIDMILRGSEGEGLDMLINMGDSYPQSPDAHFIAANAALLNLDETEDRKFNFAIREYSRAIDIDKTFAEAYINRGAIRLLMVGPAQQDIAKMREFRDPPIPRSRARGHDKALQDFDIALKLRPNIFSAHYSKACILLVSRDMDNALLEFAKAMEYAPTNTSWVGHRPKFDEERTTEVLSSGPPVSVIGGFVKYSRDNYESVVRDGERIIVQPRGLIYIQGLKDPLAFSFYLQGLCIAGKQVAEMDKAIDCISKAIELNPNVVNFYQALAGIEKSVYNDIGYLSYMKKAQDTVDKISNMVN